MAGTIVPLDVLEMMRKNQKNCCLCAVKMSFRDKVINISAKLDRHDRDVGYQTDNIMLICTMCYYSRRPLQVLVIEK